MESRLSLQLRIQPQPDETTCGPTCLDSVYRYYGDPLPLNKIIREVPTVEGGGTLAVHLGQHALQRGYRARIYTYNLDVFDPTWFTTPGIDLDERLARRGEFVKKPKLRAAIAAYREFLQHGGELRYEDLTPDLIRRYLKRSIPIITGLSSTYLYGCPREYGKAMDYDDIRGDPSGHFVVLCGYDPKDRQVLIADPYVLEGGNRRNTPKAVQARIPSGHYYSTHISTALCAILLGVLTYDANLLIIQQPSVPRAVIGELRGNSISRR